MSLITEQAQLVLTVEGKQALNEISKYEVNLKSTAESQKILGAELQKYNAQLATNFKSQTSLNTEIKKQSLIHGENSQKVKEAKQKLDELVKSETNLRTTIAQKTTEFKSNEVAAASLRTKLDELRNSQALYLRQTSSLRFEQKSLKTQMDQTTFGTESYIKALERLNEIEKELERREKTTGRKSGYGGKIQPQIEDVSIIDKVATAASAISPTISGIIGEFAGAVSIVARIYAYFKLLEYTITKAWESARELGKSIGGLTAITGIEKGSEDLQFYVKEAQILGDTYTELSPKILEAVQIVGSLKAELLDQKEALASTTEQVVLLSKASGGLLSIEESARAIVGSLNQFDEAADQSARYANVLAAGAKEGSSEIQQTAEAFKNAGVVLKQNNFTFEQSNALVQVLASKAIYGAEAGTALRNIFSKLQVTADKELNPSIVGLNTSLDNLAKLSPQEIVKLFGQESLVAAKTLITQRNEVDRLTKAVTGTNEAYDQFAKRMDNLDGDAQKFSQSWGGIFEDLGKKYEGFFRGVTQMTTEMINQIRYFNIEIGGDKLIKIQTFGDVSDQRAVEDNYKKITQKAQADARALMSDFTKSTSTETILQKQLKGLNSAIQQSQAGISMAMDNYTKARANNLSQAQIQEIINDKKYHEEKYKFARRESERLIKLDADAIATKKSLQQGYDKQNEGKEGKAADKAASIAKKAEEDYIKAKAATIAETAKLDNDALGNEVDNYEGMLRLQLSLAMIAKEKELGDSKEAQALYNQWLASSYKDVNEKVAKFNKEVEDKRLKNAEETTKKLLELTDRTTKDALQRNVAKAENSGDSFGAFNGKIALLEFERTQELRNKELTKDQKLEIDKLYNAKRNDLHAELLGKEKLRTLKQREEKLQLDIEASKGSFFENYNAKISLLNFEYAQELINAEKTGQSVENIHKKFATRRQEIDKQLWTNIGQFALQAYSMVSEGLTNSRNLEVQAEQINLDNQKGRRYQALDEELKHGKITKEQYDAEKLKADEAFEKKQRVIKRKQAEADHDANIIKATQAAIQSILQTMASVPYPFNIGFAAIQGALAFDQVSKLAAMPIPEFFYGGYTGDGGNAPKVNDGRGGFLSILHPNELTLSQDDLGTDWGQAISRIYEARSINNSIINNTSQSVLSLPQNQNQNNDSQLMAKVLMEVNKTQKSLNDTLEKGIVAKNLWTAHDVDNLSILQEKNSETKGNSLN